MAKKENSTIVHGEPTKDFFINMLVKDITLRDAIGDLVDNAVDAIKVKAKDPNDLTGFSIDIKFDENKFKIKDTGCGIEEDIARNYAFKLGKPKEHKLIDHSIGSFGIGMKRAFFKLGDNIIVNSKAPKSSFSIKIPVNEWRQDDNNWDFEFTSVNKNKNSAPTTGTTIEITDLNEEAKENFKRTQFENELKEEIAQEQLVNIGKGIAIKINGEPIKPKPITFKFNKEISPAFWCHTFQHDDSILEVEIYAGVSEEIETEGGWNIFCNDRLILAHDTSDMTGWTGGGKDGVAKYHQQYWGFRGCVFFHAKKSSSLPWNTTKTGLDSDSPEYIAVRKQMIEMMKDVIVLLNRQKKEREKDNPIKNQILNNKIRAAATIAITKLIKKKKELHANFRFPQKIHVAKEKDTKKISYSVATLRYNKVKNRLNISSPSDVGSATFDYYYENEILD